MAFQLLFSPVRPAVLNEEVAVDKNYQDNGQEAACDASVQAGLVSGGGVLGPVKRGYRQRPVPRGVAERIESLPEDKAACNTSNTPHSHECGTAEGALPLAADVVGLVSHGSRYIRVGACRHEEHAKVAHRGIAVPAHDRQADQAEQHIRNYDGPTDVVFVAKPAHAEHPKPGEGVRRGNETLRRANAETEILVENDGEEVGEGIGDGRGVEENHGVGPIRNVSHHDLGTSR